MMSFPGVVISTCFCALFLTISVGLPIFILAFYLSNYEHWNQPMFRSKYGTVLDSMRTTRYRESRKSLHKWQIAFILIFLTRRLVFAVSILWLQEYLLLHFCILYGFSSISCFYLLTFWPFKKAFDTIIEVFNEVCGILLIYHLMCFTDFVYDPMIRYKLGYTYVAVAVSNIAVHVFLILVTNINTLKKPAKTKYK